MVKVITGLGMLVGVVLFIAGAFFQFEIMDSAVFTVTLSIAVTCFSAKFFPKY